MKRSVSVILSLMLAMSIAGCGATVNPSQSCEFTHLQNLTILEGLKTNAAVVL